MLENQPLYSIGDSHVRVFSFHSAFLPLYIGAGFDNCFLTQTLAERTEQKLMRNLERLPPTATILCVFGEPDVRFQLENRFGTRALGDEPAIAAAVDRYARILQALRAEMPHGRLAAMSCIPSSRADYSRLASLYDEYLGRALGHLEIEHVDIRPHVIDQSTQLLRPKFDADGIHLTVTALPGIIHALIHHELLDASTALQADFHWSYNYRIPLADGFETRFWGDKKRTAIADAVIHHLASRHAGDKLRAWHVVDCAEGYVAFGLASAGFRRVTGFEADAGKLLMAQRAARFIQQPEPAASFMAEHVAYPPADFAVLYPWVAHDAGIIGNKLARIGATGAECYAVVSPADGTRLAQLNDGCQVQVEPIRAGDEDVALVRYSYRATKTPYQP